MQTTKTHPAPPREATAVVTLFGQTSIKMLTLSLGTGLAIFLACLAGIASRQFDSLALFWPANAILLGMMVRWPQCTQWLNWVTAFAGYCAADLITGGSLEISIWLAATNMAGVATGLAVSAVMPVDSSHVAFPRHILPNCIFRMGIVSLAGGLGAAAFCSIRLYELIGEERLAGGSFLLLSETTNYMQILPVILAVPAWNGWESARQYLLETTRDRDLLIRYLAFAMSMVAMGAIGGPGSLIFPVPALFLLASRVNVPTLSVLILLAGTEGILGYSRGFLWAGDTPVTQDVLVSLRLGVTLLTILILAYSGLEEQRRQAMASLRYTAERDDLTGLLNRRTFLERAERLTTTDDSTGMLCTIMIDLDRFKSINDTHGHAVGDSVLQRTGAVLRAVLPDHALAARFGGEEFAVLMAGIDVATASNIASLLQSRLSTNLGDVAPTASIGIAVALVGDGLPMAELLRRADSALYDAKRQGRNRFVVTASDAVLATTP